MRAEPMDEIAAATSMTAAFAGLVSVIMAVLGLAGVFQIDLAAVGVMILGAAAIFEGAAIVARAYDVVASFDVAGKSVMKTPEVTGITAETITGVAAIALGGLSVLRTSHTVLLPIAVIVLGVGVLFAGAATRRATIKETWSAISATHLIVGVAVVIVGVVGLVGSANPVVLTLAAVLVLGGEMLLSGAAIGGRIIDVLIR
ncbi:MAG: hypothetical protein KF819_12080 [Labilithrix sp.]|nr:hypothetical protein [Labilithrix sp.]